MRNRPSAIHDRFNHFTHALSICNLCPFSSSLNHGNGAVIGVSSEAAEPLAPDRPSDPASPPDDPDAFLQQFLAHQLSTSADPTPSASASHMPQIVHIELPSNLVGLTAGPASPDSQDRESVTTLIDNSTIDLSAAVSAGATLLELPLATLPVTAQDQAETTTYTLPLQEVSSSSTSGKPSTSRGRGTRNQLKATPPSKKRYVSKDTDEYRERRERNNIAVRKSRDKAKLKQNETNSRVKVLTDRNDELTKKVELLTKELNVLKGLFTNIGASLPPELKKFIKREQQQ